MMVQCPAPVTTDNFSEVWQITDKIRRKAKQNRTAGKIAFFFADLTFAVLMLFCLCGLIAGQPTSSFSRFLKEVPYFLPIWEKTGVLFLPEQHWTIRSVSFFLVITAACILVFCVFFLLLSLLYHPLKKKLPTGSEKENADKLLSLASDARRFSNQSGNSSSPLLALVFLCAAILIFTLYLTTLPSDQPIIDFFTTPLVTLLEPFLPRGIDIAELKETLFSFCQVLLMPLSLFAYLLLNRIYVLCVRFVYRYPVPYSFVAQMEYYSIFAEEDISGLPQEEAAQRRRDQAAEKRERALELESYRAYAKAKELLAEAAHGGDVPAMEHYARHCLIQHEKDPARFWLERSVESGQASEEALKILKRLKWRRSVPLSYLQ